uniref:Uncharacterized protein n=1 Tax=Arundo donax TaxID=35708 RepID=A0A0A9DWE8_ARUDO
MPSKECHMAKGKSKMYLSKLMGSWEKVIFGYHWHRGGCIQDFRRIHNERMVCRMVWSP